MSLRKDLIQSELLVTRVKQGDSEAMGELIRIWQDPLYYYIRRLVADEDDAMDIVQDIWLQVIRKFHQLHIPAAFPAWLFTIGRNHAYGHLRKARRRLIDDEDKTVAEEVYEQHKEILAGFRAKDVHYALEKLNRVHRECLTLAFIEGFSLPEVSKIVGVPLGTVKSRLYYAKKSLRNILKQEDDGYE